MKSSKVFPLMLLILILIGLTYYFLVYKPDRDSYIEFFDPKLEELRERIAVAIPEIRNVKLSGSNKSFTINKEHIFICTKDERGQYYDENMLMYVLLHELAHVLCDEVGHTEKYKQIFRTLLHRAHEAGLYDPSKPPIDDYCNY